MTSGLLEPPACIYSRGGDVLRWFYFALIIIFASVTLGFMNQGVSNLDLMKERYKRALDAGADAAARYRSYDTNEQIREISTGYGEGLESRYNVEINPEKSLEWFYRVFFKNLGFQDNLIAQLELKKYIPLKAIVAYDRLMIADLNDNWIIDETYDIDYNGKIYRFTLSDQVMDISTGIWKTDVDFGIQEDARKALVNSFIRSEINDALVNRANYESNNIYFASIALDDVDPKENSISGVNFIVMAEGMPLPSLNPWKPAKFYAFGLGGSEIVR